MRETDNPHVRNPGLFQDIPRWIWVTYLSGWSVIFGLFILFFATDRGAAFAIATMFALMAFGLPAAMAAQRRCDGPQRRGIIETRSGPLSERAAAVQIALIPTAAAFGLLAFIVLAK